MTASCSRDPSRGKEKVVEEVDLPVADLAVGIQRAVEFPEAGFVLIQVSQDKADVQLKVFAADREMTWDAPARRSTPERACFFNSAGTLKIELRSREPVKASNARLQLRIASIGTNRRGDYPSVAIEAECTEAMGGEAQARWDEWFAIASAKYYKNAAALWETLGNQARAGSAYLQSSWMLTRRSSKWVDALELGERAKGAFRQAGDSQGEAQATLAIAVSRWALTDEGRDETGAKRDAKSDILARTESDLRAAIRTFDAANDAFFAAESRGYLASNYFQQGRLREATETFAEAGARYRAAGEIEGATRALINMNVVLNRAGNYRDTSAAFDRLLRDRSSIGSEEVLADILNNSASTHSAAGSYSRALPQFVQALQIHERTGDFGGAARSLNGLASTYMRLGVPSAALVYAGQSRAVLARRGSHEGPGDLDELAAYLLAGNAQRALGDFVAARASHETALRYAHSDFTRFQAHLELLRDALVSGDVPAARIRLELAKPLRANATKIQALQWEFEEARSELLEGRVQTALVSLRNLEGQFAESGAREFEIEVLQAQAQAAYQLRRHRDALALTSRALEVLHEMRLAVGDPELRSRLTSLHRSAYELRVEVLHFLRATTSDEAWKSKYLTQMFAAADEARAGLVHESADARALSSDAATFKELREVAAEIAYREHILTALETATAPGANEQALRSELAALRARYDALTPAATSASTDFGPDDYGTERMREDSGILLFLSSKQKLRRYWLTRRGVQELAATDVVQADHLLPDAGLLAGHRRLIIVADSSLAAVPFAAAKVGDAPLVAEHDLTMALTLRDAIRIAAQTDQNSSVSLARVAVFFDPVFTPYDSRVRTRPAESSAFPARHDLRRSVEVEISDSDVRRG